MTIIELQNILNELKIPKDLYSIMKGGLPNEALCITNDEKWEVYYSERGRKSGLREFQNEEDACEYFLEKVKRYAQV